jgi:hypothetical protein
MNRIRGGRALAAQTEEPEQWLASHNTSAEVGEAIARRITGYNPAELERIWSEPTREESEAVEHAAWELTGPDAQIEELHWGELTLRARLIEDAEEEVR